MKNVLNFTKLFKLQANNASLSKKFNEAVQLKKQDQYLESLCLFKKIHKEKPNDPSIRHQIITISKKLGIPDGLNGNTINNATHAPQGKHR